MKVKIVRFFRSCRFVKYLVILFLIHQIVMHYNEYSVDRRKELNSEYVKKIIKMRTSDDYNSLFDNSYKNKEAVNYKEIVEKNDLFLNSEQNAIFDQYKPSLPNHKEKVVIPREVRSNLKQVQYTILEYTYIGGGVRFCNMSFPSDKKEGHDEFRLYDECSYTNCRFTCDKSLVRSADAFLTHLTDVEAELNQDSQARDTFFSNINLFTFFHSKNFDYFY